MHNDVNPCQVSRTPLHQPAQQEEAYVHTYEALKGEKISLLENPPSICTSVRTQPVEKTHSLKRGKGGKNEKIKKKRLEILKDSPGGSVCSTTGFPREEKWERTSFGAG